MKKRKAVYNPEADKKWIKENPERRRHVRYRSNARTFIRNYATEEDLEELAGMIEEKLDEIRKA